MRVALVISCVGCYTAAPPTTLSNKSEPVGTELTITATGVGPIDASTRATLTSLRAQLAGYDVRPVNDGSLEFDVFLAGERLLFVVPDHETGKIFNIHAVSDKIAVAGRSWRAGAVFRDAAQLTACECWGSQPTCFAKGEHVAVSFEMSCDGVTERADRRALRELDGLGIARVIWSPSAFGVGGEGEPTD